MNEITDPPTEIEPSQALQVVDKCQQAVDTSRVITPQEARNESIAHTLDAAYAKASTLQLTPEESQKLMEPFPDEDIRTGARGKSDLIYLEHAAVRRRLMEVFGPGQWAIINRRSWLDEEGGWLYADVVLLCRGCFVGECIGANRYSSNNKAVNYSDAVKGAESDALGRIAGTALGVGLQLWSKGFSEEWHARNPPQNNRREYTTSPQRTYQKPAPQANVERPATTAASVLPGKATEKTRDWAINQLTSTTIDPLAVEATFFKWGWLEAGTQGLSGWKLEHVPTSKAALTALIELIYKSVEPPQEESQQSVDSDLPEDIASAIITVPRRGMRRDEYLKNPDTIGSLYVAMKNGDVDAQKRLWGMVKGWQPEPYVDGNGKKWPVKPEDAQCRVDLDMFADFYAQKHGTE